jgi:hypothetical protein
MAEHASALTGSLWVPSPIAMNGLRNGCTSIVPRTRWSGSIHGWFRAGSQVTVRVREPLADQETMTCVIPGHHRSGREVVAELLSVQDGSLEFELSGKCGSEATFEYSSA